MIKTILSYIILFCFCLYILSGSILWATYFAYQQYIAATYCVNKQIPICNGQCHIREVEDQTQKSESPKIETRSQEILSFVTLEYDFHFSQTTRKNIFTEFISGKTNCGYSSIIIPPPKIFL
jgi:hypothetical protein